MGAMEQWITDLQTFQKKAGIEVADASQLEADWKKMTSKQRVFCTRNAQDHLILQGAATSAGQKSLKSVDLRSLANRRLSSFWPPAAPFGDTDVVVSFRTREDAEAFSRSLAYSSGG